MSNSLSWWSPRDSSRLSSVSSDLLLFLDCPEGLELLQELESCHRRGLPFGPGLVVETEVVFESFCLTTSKLSIDRDGESLLFPDTSIEEAIGVAVDLVQVFKEFLVRHVSFGLLLSFNSVGDSIDLLWFVSFLLFFPFPSFKSIDSTGSLRSETVIPTWKLNDIQYIRLEKQPHVYFMSKTHTCTHPKQNIV